MSCSFSIQNNWICTFSKLLACSSQFSSVLVFDLKCIASELKATLVVLQGQQPRHSNSTLSNRGQLAFTYQKDTAKEQGHGGKTYNVFSLTPFYQFGEDNWNIMFKQILRNKQPFNLLPKSPEPYQERR